MSVLIKGMEMPKDPVQIWIYPDGNVRVWGQDIDHDEWKKAVEVPQHGDLIDRNFVYSKIRIYADACYVTGNNKSAKIAERIEELIRDVPTIIEAEDGE